MVMDLWLLVAFAGGIASIQHGTLTVIQGVVDVAWSTASIISGAQSVRCGLYTMRPIVTFEGWMRLLFVACWLATLTIW